ncbi:MAG: protein kinase [Deltaproteobacteria bacterium]|nr:protein kinase [Deltaproteobacteria bacterium]
MSQAIARMLQPDAVFGERYRVVRCIRTGGMGAVYEATHLETGRRVAVKVMLPSLVSEPTLRARFKLEATVVASVESEHIVDVLDAGIEPATGAPFLVMELLRGDDVSTLLKREGPFAPEDVVVLLWQASLALDKTHAAGIVHRDLKPDNLFLTRRDDGSPRLKILDFGIAKVMAQSPAAGQQTATVGTPLYMAPEQINGDAIEPTCDLYSLGHIAFAMLVGRSYWFDEWQGGPVYPLLLKVLKGATEPASARAGRHGRTLPPAFDAWFAKATATSSAERFQSASALVQALSQALGVEVPAQRRQRASVGSFPDMGGAVLPSDRPSSAERLPVPPPRAPLASGFVPPTAMPTPASSPDVVRPASGATSSPHALSVAPATPPPRASAPGTNPSGPWDASAALVAAGGLRSPSHPSHPGHVQLGGHTPTGRDNWAAPPVPTPPSGVGFNVATPPRIGAAEGKDASSKPRRGLVPLALVALLFALVVCGGVVFMSWPSSTPPDPAASATSRRENGEARDAAADPVSLDVVPVPASSEVAAAASEPASSSSASATPPTGSGSARPWPQAPRKFRMPDPVGTSFY